MCLILLAYRAHSDVDLLIAGNRDEFYARPSAPPGVFGRDPLIHAGRDLEAGGTWMGRNAFGMTAALTNRRDPTGRAPPDVLSRGRIVEGLLRQATPESAAEWLAGEALGRYRPFNVLFGSARRFYFFGSGGKSPPSELEPGFYALSNSTLDDRGWPKVERSHRFFDANKHLDGETLLLGLQAFLCDPTPPDSLTAADQEEEIHGALGAVFIQTPDYGTVSASILTMGGKLDRRYYYAEAAAMASAQQGWARGMIGNGEIVAPGSAQGSPFRLVDFPE